MELLSHLAIILIILPCFGAQSARTRSYNVTIVENQLASYSYDKRVRPLVNSEKPLDVNATFYFVNLNAVSEESSEFALEGIMLLKYKDPRLAYGDGPKCVTIPPDFAVQKLWIPDVFIRESRDIYFHSTFQGTLKSASRARVCQDGTVKIYARMALRVYCNMNFKSFPMDTQRCNISIESYMYQKTEVNIQWGKRSAYKWRQIQPVAFHPISISAGDCPLENYPYAQMYSCITMEVKLKRIASHYLALIYLPAMFMVFLSCATLWLPVKALLERAFLSIFLLLSMAVLMGVSQYATPQVGYLKAIDIWVVSCFTFLLVATMEVIALFLLSRGSTGVGLPQLEMTSENNQENPDIKKTGFFFTHPQIVQFVDLGLRIGYPAVFVLFLVIYFSIYHT